MTRHAREFHSAFNLDRPPYPTVPDAALAALRLRLLKEEMAEVDAEFQILLKQLRTPGVSPEAVVGTLQRLVKEVCDLRYIGDGTLVALGLDDEPYDEVHRSNMSKLDNDGNPLYRADGKVLKGPNYSEADPNKMFPPIITIPEEDITDA